MPWIQVGQPETSAASRSSSALSSRFLEFQMSPLLKRIRYARVRRAEIPFGARPYGAVIIEATSRREEICERRPHGDIGRYAVVGDQSPNARDEPPDYRAGHKPCQRSQKNEAARQAVEPFAVGNETVQDHRPMACSEITRSGWSRLSVRTKTRQSHPPPRPGRGCHPSRHQPTLGSSPTSFCGTGP